MIQCAEELPPDVDFFQFQVSGHKHGQGRLGLGILKHKNGKLLKPMFEDYRAATELSFYETVSKNNESDPILQELTGFLPSFYGTWKTTFNGKDIQYLCLEDVCNGFQNPSLLEVKIGSKVYDHKATAEKIKSMTTKYTYGAELGIRICGMKVYREDVQEYMSPEKKSFHHLSPETISSAFKMYFNKSKQTNTWILSVFIHKLVQLDNWFSKQRRFIFIASSLLFMYEGDEHKWLDWTRNNKLDEADYTENSNSEQSCQANSQNIFTDERNTCNVCGLNNQMCLKLLDDKSLYRLAMIDFSHTTPSDTEDSNYIYGLRNLIVYFKNLLKNELDST